MSAFVNRIVEEVNAHAHLTIFLAERVWGTPYIFSALSEQAQPCVWLELNAEDEGDKVAAGNRLAAALSRAFGTQVVGQGMPYNYVVAILGQHLGLLGPLTLILSGAEVAQGLALALAELHGVNAKVVLEFRRLPNQFLIPETAYIFQEDSLRLTPEEAHALVGTRLSEIETLNLLRLSGGAYETFLLALRKRLSLPPKLRPHPEGAALPPDADMTVPPSVFLSVLVRREQWVEALEVAAEHIPERVPELLNEAGEAYLARGLYAKLNALLEALPETLQGDERVLFWRLRSAYRLNRTEGVRGSVERFLTNHEAPDLRALYAAQLPGERAFREIERAYQAAKTFTTSQHYGNAWTIRDPERGLMVFRDLITLSEEMSPTEKVAATMMVAFPLGLLSRYHEAASWLERALTTFDEAGLGDWQLRLHTLSNLAYTRILIGETIGLREVLQREVEALQAAFPERAVAFRSTLGDYHLSQGESEAALSYYLENLSLFETKLTTRDWNFPPYLLYNAVQGLLHADKGEQAGALMREHYFLLKEAPGQVSTYAQLAYGMVLALSEPDAAIGPLEAACKELETAFKGDHLVSACLYLAKAHFSLGDTQGAQAALERAKVGLKELSETGFRLLAGPEAHFREVKALWRGQAVALSLTFLGEPKVTLRGEVVGLFPQQLEVLALLAQHPEGLRSEQLLLLLYGETGKLSTLKALLSKLRRLVPITRPPYRLDLSYEADFLTLETLLRKGHLRAGLELYKGSLLPKSDAPGIVELRDTLEELLRQAALTSRDPDALLNLSEHFSEDLELWEASLAALPEHDPRRALAAAMQKRVLETWA